MTDTLFKATLRVAQTLGITLNGKATGGTTTTLIDTVNLKQSDNHFNEGSIWATKTTDGAAPQGKFARISAFVQSSNQATHEAITTWTAGDFYSIAPALYPLSSIIEAINLVLERHDIVVEDTTSLDTVAGQSEYTLPAAVKRGGLLGVWVEGNTGDADDNRWIKIHNWALIVGTTGNQDTVVIPYQTGGRDIRIQYIGKHADVFEDTDSIDEAISIGALAVHAAVEAINKRMAMEKMSKYLVNQFNRLSTMAENMAVVRFPPEMPTKFNIVSRSEDYPRRDRDGDTYS
jgi:hypothetical protein